MSNEPRNEFVINITTDGELVALALKELYPFSRHPYKVRDDDAMRDMAESVKQYGVLSPAIARTLPDGGYELVSGHRRKRACELAGLETMPVIVRELDDDGDDESEFKDELSQGLSLEAFADEDNEADTFDFDDLELGGDLFDDDF